MRRVSMPFPVPQRICTEPRPLASDLAPPLYALTGPATDLHGPARTGVAKDKAPDLYALNGPKSCVAA